MAPRPVRIAVGAVVTLLVVSAIYLLIVRGPALLLDLAANAAAFICY